MPESATEFQKRLLRKMLVAGRRRARRYILSGSGAHKSRQLAREMQVIVASPSKGYIYVDPYWAVYFHDGRDSIVGKNLVWFRNRRLDPRLRGGRSPNRARDLRHLTKEQFRSARRQGLLVIRQSVRGVAPTPFFSNTGGMSRFSEEVGGMALEEFRSFVISHLGSSLNTVGDISVGIHASL